MEREKNPFDRDQQSVPLIRFMLHTNSLTSEILLKDSPAYRLVKLNHLKEIGIMSLPTTSNDIREVLKINNIVFTEYYSYDSGVGLKASDGSIYNVVSRSPKNIWEPIISDSSVALADLFASGVCDYLVVGASELSLKCKVARDSIITAEQALEMVRIILTAHGRFYVGTKIPTSEWFYYLYRFKKLFKWYQYAWTIAAYAHGKGLSEKIHDYLLSLGTRLEFICRAYDKVAFFSLKTANYDDLQAVMYKGAGYRSAIAVGSGHTAALVYLPDYKKATVVFELEGEPGWVWAEATGKNNPLGWVSKEFINIELAAYELGEEAITPAEPSAVPSAAVASTGGGTSSRPFPFISIIGLLWLMSMFRRRRRVHSRR